MPLRETKAGLCGFEINVERSQRRLDAPPQVLADTDQEVVLEDNIPGDQVMIVKKIAPESEAGEKVRATIGMELIDVRMKLEDCIVSVTTTTHHCFTWSGCSLSPSGYDIETSTGKDR